MNLPQPPIGRFDYMSGHAIWMQPGEAEHNYLIEDIRKCIECCRTSRFYVLKEASTQLRDENGKTFLTVSNPKYGVVHPDGAVFKRERTSTGSSETSRPIEVTKRIQICLPYSDNLVGVFEISSPSTVRYDLIQKWQAYARSGIPMYVIFDRMKSRIIVGLRNWKEGYSKSSSGDKDVVPPLRETRRSKVLPFFFRRVYEGSEVVDCPGLRHLGLTVKQLLDPVFMRRKARALDNDRADQVARAETAEQQANLAREEATTAREEATTAKVEASTAKQEASTAKQEASTAKKELNDLKDLLRVNNIPLPKRPTSQTQSTSTTAARLPLPRGQIKNQIENRSPPRTRRRLSYRNAE